MASQIVHAQTASSTSERLNSVASGVNAKVIAWRRDIHQHPELGNREFRTSALVASHLKGIGLEVRVPIAHTGVAAVLRGAKPGPTIAFRADMDALPITEETDVPFKSTVTTRYRDEAVGVMHACGHDAHTAILMGVAEALSSMRSELAGTVLFIFQPAEEGAPDGEKAGAKRMIDEGLFDIVRPEAVFGLHVAAATKTGTVGYRSGVYYSSSNNYRITVRGRQTHGARPWAGIDPIVVSSQIVLALQTIVSRQTDISQAPAVVTVGAIKGGVRENIIPDSVEMIGTVRTYDEKTRDDILMRMQRTAENIASASGATAEFKVADRVYPVTVNDPNLTARIVPVIQSVVGKENVRVVPLATAAEDFSEYAKLVPGFFFSIGVMPTDRDPATAASVHSPRFYLDEASLGVGVRVMLQIAADFLLGAKP